MNIFLNGKKIDTSNKYAHELSSNIDNIIVINGFQTNDNYLLKENDYISIIDKKEIPKKDELEALMVARHTPLVHDKIKNSKVAIAGLGGLGSNIAIMLARTGVGTLLLIDFDTVDATNLNRQSYYIEHLGLYKTEALKSEIKRINPYINIITKNMKIDNENIVNLFDDYDVVCEAFDKATAKAMIVNHILENYPNKKIVSGSGMAGYYSSNLIKTHKKMKNLYICGDLTNEAQIGEGLMSPRVNICAGHQANMILRLLLNIEDI